MVNGCKINVFKWLHVKFHNKGVLDFIASPVILLGF